MKRNVIHRPDGALERACRDRTNHKVSRARRYHSCTNKLFSLVAGFLEQLVPLPLQS